MKVSEPITHIMTTDVITVNTSNKLSEVRRLMADNSIHHMPVVDGQRLTGIISYSDILELSFTESVTDPIQRDAFLDDRCTITALMNSDVVTVSNNATLRDAAKALVGGRIHSVPVVDGKGHLSGMITSTDLIRTLLDWACDAKVAVIPFGGGTSVVGGVEGDVDDRYRAVVSLDLGQLDRVLDVERSSMSARIQAGATGPALESQLAEHGLTLRHFPQSFEFSTLGGWLATRAGGHFATVYTHIDDLVQSMRAVTPSGLWESRRLPGSGAGPSPDRVMLGSEGIFGVITEAWMHSVDTP